MRIRPWLFVGLFFGALAQAQDLPRHNPVPGGIAVVPIALVSASAPVVHFNGDRVMVLAHDGHWKAVVGLPLTLVPGQQNIMVVDHQGAAQKHSFSVLPKEYAEQRLTVKNKRMVNPSAEDLARIEREQEIIRRVFASWTEVPARPLLFGLPAQGRISSVFGLRRFFNDEPRQPHSGLDIAAPLGARVVAPFEGTVVETGEYFFNGKTVFIDHGQGLVSMFNHLSRITVKHGTRVARGTKIGEAGMTGRVTGPHLHWSISLNNNRVDPELFLPGKKSARNTKNP